MTSHLLAKQSQDRCWCCKPQYPFWDQSSFNAYHWRIFSLVQLLEVGLPKCVAMKFSVIMREESFVHCCVGKLAVKVGVETLFAILKIAYRDFHASSPSQVLIGGIFVHWIRWSVIPWQNDRNALSEVSLMSYTFWKIVCCGFLPEACPTFSAALLMVFLYFQIKSSALLFPLKFAVFIIQHWLGCVLLYILFMLAGDHYTSSAINFLSNK